MKIVNYLIQYILIKIFFLFVKLLAIKMHLILGRQSAKKLVQNLNQKKLLKKILI